MAARKRSPKTSVGPSDPVAIDDAKSDETTPTDETRRPDMIIACFIVIFLCFHVHTYKIPCSCRARIVTAWQLRSESRRRPLGMFSTCQHFDKSPFNFTKWLSNADLPADTNLRCNSDAKRNIVKGHFRTVTSSPGERSRVSQASAPRSRESIRKYVGKRSKGTVVSHRILAGE